MIIISWRVIITIPYLKFRESPILEQARRLTFHGFHGRSLKQTNDVTSALMVWSKGIGTLKTFHGSESWWWSPLASSVAKSDTDSSIKVEQIYFPAGIHSLKLTVCPLKIGRKTPRKRITYRYSNRIKDSTWDQDGDLGDLYNPTKLGRSKLHHGNLDDLTPRHDGDAFLQIGAFRKQENTWQDSPFLGEFGENMKETHLAKNQVDISWCKMPTPLFFASSVAYLASQGSIV